MAKLFSGKCDYVEVLIGEGYTSREARFLLVAGEHSGFFSMGQFRRYLAVKAGKTSDRLMHRLLDADHAKLVPSTSRHRAVLSFTPRFCDLIEVPRARGGEARIRLQVLDYVIANPAFDYVAREPEKVAYFVHHLGINEKVLPKFNGHYFDERMPIFASRDGAGFVFVDNGSLNSFEHFLERYAPLFSSMKTARVVYVTTSRHPTRGRKTFDATLRRIEKNRSELTLLERARVQSLKAAELRLMKGLRESVGLLEGSLEPSLGVFLLRDKFAFVK